MIAVEHITRAVHEFYPDSTPKACGDKAFWYQIMGGHDGDTREFVKGPHPKVTFMTRTVS